MLSETAPRPAERTVSGPASRVAFGTHAGGRETAIVAGLALSAGIAAGVVFTVRPDLDLAASRLFFGGWKTGFPLAGQGFVQSLREFFLRSFTVWYIVVVCAGILAYRLRAPVLNLAPERWIYIGLCSIAGPLLLVNVFLKEYWGRWRPREIVEFGGYELFTTPFNLSGTCSDNCSFVSGEVASMVMIFVALGFATRHWRPIHFGLAIIMGALETFIRVSQGGHFLSDSIFSAVLMTLTAAGLYWLMFLSRWRMPPARDP